MITEKTLTDRLWEQVIDFDRTIRRIRNAFKSAVRETLEEMEIAERRRHYGTSNNVIWTEFSNKTDVPDRIVSRKITGCQVIIDEWDDTSGRNRDIPDNMAYVDMGIEERRNPHLDHIKTDDRLFKEQCTRYGNTLYVIYQKAIIDHQPALQNKAEWLQEKLQCEYRDALTLAECFKRIGIGKQMALKMIFGYFDQTNMEWRNGLSKIGPAAGKRYAQYFENLVIQLEADEIPEEELRRHYHDVAGRMIDSGDWAVLYDDFTQTFGFEPTAWDVMDWIEDMAANGEITISEPITITDEDFNGYVSHLGDEEQEPRLDEFGAHPLQNDANGLDYELIAEINSAGPKEIKEIQQRMFPRNTMWGYRKAEYRWMNTAHRQLFWSFVNGRKEKLAKETIKEVTPASMKIIEMMKDLPSLKQRRALIASYCAGNSFNMYGQEINFDHRPSSDEVYGIWALFRQINQ